MEKLVKDLSSDDESYGHCSNFLSEINFDNLQFKKIWIKAQNTEVNYCLEIEELILFFRKEYCTEAINEDFIKSNNQKQKLMIREQNQNLDALEKGVGKLGWF